MANDLLLPVVPVEVPPEGVSISRAAEITGLGIEALRYYERAGLMLGHTRRDSGGRRRYRQADLARAQRHLAKIEAKIAAYEAAEGKS